MKYCRLFLILIIIWLCCEFVRGEDTIWYATSNMDYSTGTWSNDDFENTQLEETTNGTFTGNATGWTLDASAEVAYNSNNLKVDYTADAAITFGQDASNTPLTVGDVYRLEYTLSGQVGMEATELTLSAGSAFGSQTALGVTDATHTYYFEVTNAAPTLDILFSADGLDAGDEFIIDNISCKKMNAPELVTNGEFTDWTDPTVPDDWGQTTPTPTHYVEQSGNGLRFVSDGTTHAITQTCMTIGKTYVITIKIDTVTDGAIKLGDTVDSDRWGSYSTVGIHSVTATAGNTTLLVQEDDAGSTDLVIDSISVRETYGEEEVTNGDFATEDLTGWTNDASGWTYDADGGNFAVTSDYATQADAAKTIYQDFKTAPVNGDIYRFEYEVTANTGVTASEFQLLITGCFGNVSDLGLTVATHVCYLTVTDDTPTTADLVFVTQGLDDGDTITIDNISCKKVAALTPANIGTGDTLIANGYTVDIDESVDCSSIETDAAEGGFTVTAGGWDTPTIDDTTAVWFQASDNSINTAGSTLFLPITADAWIWVTGSTTELYTNGPKLNNGFFYVTAKTATKITIANPWGGTLLDEAVGGTIDITIGGTVIDADIVAGASDCLTLATTTNGDAVLIVGDVTAGDGASVDGVVLNGITATGYYYFHGDVFGGVGAYSLGINQIDTDCKAYIVGDAYSGSGVYSSAAYGKFQNDVYVYGNLVSNNVGVPVASLVIWNPTSSSNYIQYPLSTGTIKAYASQFFPDAVDVLYGVDRGDGTTGVLTRGVRPLHRGLHR